MALKSAAKMAGLFGVTRMPRIFILRAVFIAMALGLAGAAPSYAQDSTLDGAQKEAVEGLSKLLDALGMFVKSVPQYSAPEVLPNGDIIIRRIHPDQRPAPAQPKSHDDDPTSST